MKCPDHSHISNFFKWSTLLRKFKKINNSKIALLVLFIGILITAFWIYYKNYMFNGISGYEENIKSLEKKYNINIPFITKSNNKVFYFYKKKITGYYIQIYGVLPSCEIEKIQKQINEKKLYVFKTYLAGIDSPRHFVLPQDIITHIGITSNLESNGQQSYFLENVYSDKDRPDIYIITYIQRNEYFFHLILNKQNGGFVLTVQKPPR